MLDLNPNRRPLLLVLLLGSLPPHWQIVDPIGAAAALPLAVGFPLALRRCSSRPKLAGLFQHKLGLWCKVAFRGLFIPFVMEEGWSVLIKQDGFEFSLVVEICDLTLENYGHTILGWAFNLRMTK